MSDEHINVGNNKKPKEEAPKMDAGEIRAIVYSLKSEATDDGAILQMLKNMGLSDADSQKYLKEASDSQPAPQAPAKPAPDNRAEVAQQNMIREEDIGDFFEAPKETVDLPSGGHWYPGGKSTVTIKHLTATEDDILYDAALINKNEQMNSILDKAVIDRDLRPKDMLTCDRDYLLIRLRQTGLGDEFEGGVRGCGSCGYIYNPDVDLSQLKVKPVKHLPDENGEFSMTMKKLPVNIKFRLLNGRDEARINKKALAARNAGKFSVNNSLTDKYLLHIMEVNDKRDKVYIQSYVNAMPMQDSKLFRDKLKEVEPGLDLSYEFECPNCQHKEHKPVIITHKLYYPDAEI